VSLTAAPPVATPVLTRNVVAALPGTDPKLRHDWVIVSAHYDAVGKLEGGEGDRIRNGANDNASGVAGMLSVAGALARLPHARGGAFCLSASRRKRRACWAPDITYGIRLCHWTAQSPISTSSNWGGRMGRLTAPRARRP
jgi:Zn-dependent M28 family amino/carboxypeptidase